MNGMFIVEADGVLARRTGISKRHTFVLVIFMLDARKDRQRKLMAHAQSIRHTHQRYKRELFGLRY
jgi:hypothetical protein